MENSRKFSDSVTSLGGSLIDEGLGDWTVGAVEWWGNCRFVIGDLKDVGERKFETFSATTASVLQGNIGAI